MEQIIDRLITFTDQYLMRMTFPQIKWTDIVEILILSVLIYRFLTWVKDTKAFSLLKGLGVIAVFCLIAALFNMTTILWIVKNVIGVALTALIVVFQPELRRALEQLGKRKVFPSLFKFDTSHVTDERFSDRTINEIIKASYEMGRAKTGALIVIAQNDNLSDYEKTGIRIDAEVSSQLFINIFEHNTPLHDGAVIVSGDRIVSATCYLPLSENMGLSKELGTRHRAGVGVSEVTDSMTVIVSEETGRVSIAYKGELIPNVDADVLREKLQLVQNKIVEDSKVVSFLKGRSKNEKQ